ncbi:unnamed protein product [Cylicostephanus goldi]|uniref:G-protein coupled receptors family 1 profile domain-containing protein n=1 Tax=Cylicostephanus goldi TaxID=71465 RepID=A0A3P7MS32_CYLGO|nr:unnamed protein product [Cylicostephanus goldi]
MVVDMFLYLNIMLHDLPSFIMDRDISKETQFLSVIVNCTEWFVQLLMLPLLSIMHFVAIYWPTIFRGISFRQFAFCNAGTVLIAMSCTSKLPHMICNYRM